jgi:hypothetical protein
MIDVSLGARIVTSTMGFQPTAHSGVSPTIAVVVTTLISDAFNGTFPAKVYVFVCPIARLTPLNTN